MKYAIPIDIQSTKTILRKTTYIVNSIYTGDKSIVQKLGRIMLNDFRSELSDEYFSEKNIAIEKQL